jgi:hypothetical protein
MPLVRLVFSGSRLKQASTEEENVSELEISVQAWFP